MYDDYMCVDLNKGWIMYEDSKFKKDKNYKIPDDYIFEVIVNLEQKEFLRWNRFHNFINIRIINLIYIFF